MNKLLKSFFLQLLGGVFVFLLCIYGIDFEHLGSFCIDCVCFGCACGASMVFLSGAIVDLVFYFRSRKSPAPAGDK